MSDLQDLIQEKTADEMLEIEIGLAQDEELDTTTWQEGSIIRTILVIVANVFAMFSSIIAEPILGGFGDLVGTLAWAKVWAKQMFDVDHIPAEAATGTITAVNTSDTEYIPGAGELIVAHEVTGKLYRNVSAVTIPANDTVTDIEIAAIEVGTASNAAPNKITVIVGPSLDGVTITNPAAVLGSDDETKAALITRAREKLAALSPLGPKEAYNYIVKTPEFAATASAITRSSTFMNPATGAVSVYIATATGAPTSSDVAICQTAIDTYAEPWCTSATAIAATEVEIDVTYEVWVRSSLTEAQIETAIENAIAEYISTLAIGGEIIPPAEGTLYVDAIMVVVASAELDGTPVGVVRATVSLPTDDVALDEDEVAILGTVTGTINYL